MADPIVVRLKEKSIKKLSLGRRIEGITGRERLLLMEVQELSLMSAARLAGPVSLTMRLKLRRLRRFLGRVLLTELCMPIYTPLVYHDRDITIDTIQESMAHSMFRFRTKEHLRRVYTALKIPAVVKLDNGGLIHGEKYFLISLYRMAFPHRWPDVALVFGIHWTVCSRCSTHFFKFMNVRWSYLITNNLNYWKSSLPEFANCIRQKITDKYAINYIDANEPGGFVVFGFIDDTLNPMCRPFGGPQTDGVDAERYAKEIQQAFYTGWKKLHGMKYQTINLPNGMIMDAFGGSMRRNDNQYLNASHILDRLATLQLNDLQQYVIYGDSAFGWDTHLRSRYADGAADPLTAAEINENVAMSAMRQSIEWDYKDVKTRWALIDYKKMLKLGQAKVVDIFMTAMLLSNILSTLIGNQSSQYFSCMPPTLEDYLSQGPRDLVN